MGKEDIAYEWLEKGIEAREGVALFTAIMPSMRKYQVTVLASESCSGKSITRRMWISKS